MHFHWQNLNEKWHGRVREKGTPLRHGRAWLNFSERFSIGWCWEFFSSLVGYGVHLDGDDGRVVFRFAIPWLLSFWFHVEWPWLLAKLGLDYASAKRREERARGGSVVPTRDIVPACYDMNRRFQISFHDLAIWWSFWDREHYHSRSDPWWQRGCWHYIDTLLGERKYSKTVLETRQATIPLPEASYPATIEIHRAVWKRPRWPWPKVIIGSYVDFRRNDNVLGPPVPGKGENSWDCGPDSFQALSLSAKTVHDAIGETVKRVLSQRVRRGGALDYNERE